MKSVDEGLLGGPDGQVVASVFNIYEQGLDWCHMCGGRTNPTLSFSVPENAEGGDFSQRAFVRMCVECVEGLHEAAEVALGRWESEGASK